MKVVSITDVRQDATKLVELAQKTREPILICVHSRPTAYIVEAEGFEAQQRDVKRLRHDLFWYGVDEAEAEHRAGQSRTCEDANESIADLELEK